MNSKILLLLFLLLPISQAFASPSIASFTASPTSVNYGMSTLISWTINDGGGASLYFICPTGVTIKTLSGTAFPCSTKQSVSSSASDSASFYINNLTGTPRSVTVRLIPKDSSGTDYDAGSSDISVSAGFVPQPITSFDVATTSASSDSTVTLNWTGVEVGGTNIQFDCVSGVTITSVSPVVSTPLPCAVPAYSSDLPKSGSVTLNFSNTNSSVSTISARILPAISVGSYDAVHSLSTSFNIKPNPLAPTNFITSLTSSKSLVNFGDKILFSWTSQGIKGINLKTSCVDSITPILIQGTTTSSIKCGYLVFDKALSPNASTTLSFFNNSSSNRYITISFLPQLMDGTYDGTKSQDINLTILPQVTVQENNGSTQQNYLNTLNANTTGNQKIKATRTLNFSTYMEKGSTGKYVTALQKFLAQDKALYPEGKVTGTYGPATELAVKRFQERYGLAKKGDAGYGSIGPKTRAKLNSLEYF